MNFLHTSAVMMLTRNLQLHTIGGYSPFSSRSVRCLRAFADGRDFSCDEERHASYADFIDQVRGTADPTKIHAFLIPAKCGNAATEGNATPLANDDGENKICYVALFEKSKSCALRDDLGSNFEEILESVIIDKESEELKQHFSAWLHQFFDILGDERFDLVSRFPQRYVLKAVETASDSFHSDAETDASPTAAHSSGQTAGSYTRENVDKAFVPKGFYACKVTRNNRLTPDDYARPSHLISFDISGTPFSYKPGYLVEIWPKNRADEVERACRLLNVSADAVFQIEPFHPEKNEPLPDRYKAGPITVGELFSSCLDIQGAATRGFIASFALLAEKNTNSNADAGASSGEALTEASTLKALASDFTTDSEYSKSTRTTSPFSFLDVLEKHPYVSLTLEQFVSIVPPQRPRAYSVASSPLLLPGAVDIQIVLLQYGTFSGCATSYLASLRSEDEAIVRVKPGYQDIDLESCDCSTHFCGVALGSGLALHRSIIQHFYGRYLEARGSNAKLSPSSQGHVPTPHMTLFLGVRTKAEHLLAEEFAKYEEAGIITLKTAFSHEQAEFITPATLMDADPEAVARPLVDCNKGTRFLYCGPAGEAWASIERSVRSSIERARPECNAESLIADLKSRRLWSVNAFTPAADPENPFA